MRWVVMIVIALFAVIVAIFAAGAVLPRKHAASVMTRISQPPRAVWTVITNHADDPNWRPELASISRLPDRNGHPVWLETYKNGMKLEMEDTVAEPSKKLVRELRDAANMFSGRWEIVIAAEGANSSTMHITEYGEVPNPFFRFMSRFVFGHTKSMEQYLTALASKFGESNTPSVVNTQ